MNSNNVFRLGAATAVAALACAAAPAVAASAPSGSSADVPREQRTTRITLDVPDCEGCAFQLTQARWADSPGTGVSVWTSKEKKVRDGEVRFRVPTHRTHGLSAVVEAPWEGHLGYVTTVAMRYGGEQAGDEVGFREARGKSKASACWAGTRDKKVTIPVTVRKVWVDGAHDRVRGSIAYASTTQDWEAPMREAWDGVLGSQDVNVCGER